MSAPKSTTSQSETALKPNLKRFAKKTASGCSGGSDKMKPPRWSKLAKMTQQPVPHTAKPATQKALGKLRFKSSSNEKYKIKQKSTPKYRRSTSRFQFTPSQIYYGPSYENSSHTHDTRSVGRGVITGDVNAERFNFGDNANNSTTVYSPARMGPSVDDDGDERMADANEAE